MQISISDPILQTQIFIAIFIAGLLFSLKKKTNLGFSNEVSEELKGFAILAVVFSHIGYFLVTDHQFLYPLSVLAGVGVNLFLFLSGFGLRKSWQKSNPSIFEFYRNRLLKLFSPFLIILISFLILDRLFLNIVYPVDLTIKNLFGFFPSADIYHNINSPFWYFSLIFFYYLLAPVFFKAKDGFLCAILMFLFSYFIFNSVGGYLKLPLDPDVQDLYRVHFIAFPLGVAFASFDQRFFFWVKKFQLFVFPLALILLFYTAVHSGIGEDKFTEQAVSLVTMGCVITIFVLNKYQLRLFNLFGRYSYEIYLVHWPILYRYDHLYKILPASIATLFYLIEFLGLGVMLQKLVSFIAGLKKWPVKPH